MKMYSFVFSIIGFCFFGAAHSLADVGEYEFRGNKIRDVKAGDVSVDWAKQTKPLILRYQLYSLEEYEKFVEEKKRVLIGRVNLENSVSLTFYERPVNTIGNYNSTLEITKDGKSQSYDIGQILKSQAVSLGYIAIIRSTNNEPLIICNYIGQPSEREQGFILIRLRAGQPSLHSLPLTNYGKVVVSGNNLDRIELWSALDSEVNGHNALTTYNSRYCKIKEDTYECGDLIKHKRRVAPGSIIDPAIEIKR